MEKHYFYRAELIDSWLEIVVVDDGFVSRIDYVDEGVGGVGVADVVGVGGDVSKLDESVDEIGALCMRELDQYFAGSLKVFTFPVKFVDGTPFQQGVWNELRQIQFGETISYRELALKCGGANYSRAVANANGKNPVSIVVPCHRVISSDGSLGGYTGGIDKKQTLLAHEGVVGGPGKMWV